MKPKTEAERTPWRDCYEGSDPNHPFFIIQVGLMGDAGSKNHCPPPWDRAHINCFKAELMERRRRETKD